MNKIINAYKNFWLQIFDFQGSTSRYDWWMVQVANFFISLASSLLFFKRFDLNIYGLICILPQIAIDIRRVRDFGKNWKWIFINLIPFLGWLIWFLWMGFGRQGRGKEHFL